METTLASIWCEVLGVDAVTGDSNFFGLGGDSILVMTMLFHVEEQLGVFLDPGAIFAASTLREFVLEVERAQTGVEAPALSTGATD